MAPEHDLFKWLGETLKPELTFEKWDAKEYGAAKTLVALLELQIKELKSEVDELKKDRDCAVQCYEDTKRELELEIDGLKKQLEQN